MPSCASILEIDGNVCRFSIRRDKGHLPDWNWWPLHRNAQSTTEAIFFFVSCDFKREISDFDICWVFNEFFKDSFDSYDLTWPVFLSIEQTNTHRCDKRNREMCKYVMENAIVSRHLNQRLHSPFAKMKSTRTALATRHHSRACDRNGNNIFWCFAVGCGCGKQHNKQMTPD